MPRKAPSQPRKAARQDRSKATVDAILEAATRLFQRGDLDSVTTNEIAGLAGVSVGSLYQYFPSKQAILGQLIDRHAERTLRRLVEALPDPRQAPLEGMLRRVVEILLEADTMDRKLHRLFLDKLPEVGRTERRQEEIRFVIQAVRALMQVRRDEIRPCDPAIAAFVLVHAVEAVTNAAVFELPDRLKDPTLVDEIVALAVRYLR